MFKRTALGAFIFAVVLSMGSVVQALTFDFVGAAAVSQGSWLFEAQGVSVVATALANGVARNVHRDRFGLGVTFTGDKALDGPSQQIDGRGYLEFLTLTFSEPVTLRDMVLSYWEENDEMTLLVDGEAGRSSGRVFDFSAPEQDDDYKLQSIEVERVASGSVAETAGVPEVGTAWLVGVGLVGLARRKRRT